MPRKNIAMRAVGTPIGEPTPTAAALLRIVAPSLRQGTPSLGDVDPRQDSSTIQRKAVTS